MGFWSKLAGKPAAYAPGFITFDEDRLVLRSEDELTLDLAPTYGIKIYGTISSERRALTEENVKARLIEGVQGIACLPQNRDIKIDIKAGRVKGKIWHAGSLETTIADITITRPMNIVTTCRTVHAPGFTKVIQKYILSTSLPEKVRKPYDLFELTDEEVNTNWEALHEIYTKQPELRIKGADVVRVTYMP